MENMNNPLGIIAGSGHLPLQLIEKCRAKGREVFVVAIENDTDSQTVENVPHVWIRLGAIGTAIEHLRKAGVSELVLAGKINRPSMSALKPDAMGAKLIAKLGFSIFGGDTKIFKTILNFLEEEGFKIVGSEEISSEILADEGILGKHKPSEQDQKDMQIAKEVLQAIGIFDIGQGVIVKNGLVLGIEAAEGTDSLIERCGKIKGEGKGGVLLKSRKPIQEERVDLPTIGIQTIELIAQAGFAGIAIEAGHSLILDREQAITTADRLGIFIYGS
ncbi:MAG: UDP-2,3-diacylglucosamine diphosphatase LpxI, partial [Pseudomonadota bacterium]